MDVRRHDQLWLLMLFRGGGMKKFRQFLKKEYVDEQALDHYLAWVEHYAKYCKDRSLDYWDESSVISYIEILISRVERWKATQAEDAVRKYMFWRRGESDAKREAYLSQLRKHLRKGKRSQRTEDCYLNWVRRFFKFNGKDSAWVADDVKLFIIDLVKVEKVSIASQNQAVAALRYFYKNVLMLDLGDTTTHLRRTKRRNLPIFLNHEELGRVFSKLDGRYLLLVKLMYGTGLRAGECYKLRVQDVDFDKGLIYVRDRTGEIKRETLLPNNLREKLNDHVKEVKKLYTHDTKLGVKGVELPVLYSPTGEEAASWEWYWFFPAASLKVINGELQRKACHEWSLQQKFKKALDEAKVLTPANLDSLRHSFAVHLLDAGYDIRTVQELLGHQDVKTTMVYSKLSKIRVLSAKSPLDIQSDS